MDPARRARRGLRWVLTGTAVLAAVTAASLARAEGERERGRKLAIEKCAQCHVVGDHNPYGGVSNSPSFYIFSERLEVYRERLRTFDQRRPHLSRDMKVPPAEIRDIIAYVEALERP